jgi:hypothetical protein
VNFDRKSDVIMNTKHTMGKAPIEGVEGERRKYGI